MEELTPLQRAERTVTRKATEYGLWVMFSGPDDNRKWDVWEQDGKRSRGRYLGWYTPQDGGKYQILGEEGHCDRPFRMVRIFRDCKRTLS